MMMMMNDCGIYDSTSQCGDFGNVAWVMNMHRHKGSKFMKDDHPDCLAKYGVFALLS